MRDVSTAFDAIEEAFKKYYVLLVGKSLEGLQPAQVGDDWKDVFTFGWYERPQRPGGVRPNSQ